MFRGFGDPDSLDSDETFRFYSSLYGAMKTWEAVTHYSIEKGVHAWGAEGMHATMRSFFETAERMDAAYERQPGIEEQAEAVRDTT